MTPRSRREHRPSTARAPGRIIFDDVGTVLVEYALVLSVLSFAFIAGMEIVGNVTSGALTNLGTELANYNLKNGL